MNRAEQAKNTTALLNLAEVNSATNAYKPLRPSQILQSEKFVSRIMEILKEEYVNPFDVNLTQRQLVNLSSGVALPDEMTSEILSARSVGEEECEKFCSERLESNKVKFHEPIKRKKLPLFSNSSRKITIEENKKAKSIEVNRNILGTLLSFSTNAG